MAANVTAAVGAAQTRPVRVHPVAIVEIPEYKFARACALLACCTRFVRLLLKADWTGENAGCLLFVNPNTDDVVVFLELPSVLEIERPPEKFEEESEGENDEVVGALSPIPPPMLKPLPEKLLVERDGLEEKDDLELLEPPPPPPPKAVITSSSKISC